MKGCGGACPGMPPAQRGLLEAAALHPHQSGWAGGSRTGGLHGDGGSGTASEPPAESRWAVVQAPSLPTASPGASPALASAP